MPTTASQKDFKSHARTYQIGTLLCFLLTLVSFLPFWMGWPKLTSFWIVLTFGFVQVIVQLHFFLHISWKGQQREDLQLILFTSLLLGIMVLGTFWVMDDLSGMMMDM